MKAMFNHFGQIPREQVAVILVPQGNKLDIRSGGGGGGGGGHLLTQIIIILTTMAEKQIPIDHVWRCLIAKFFDRKTFG